MGRIKKRGGNMEGGEGAKNIKKIRRKKEEALGEHVGLYLTKKL